MLEVKVTDEMLKDMGNMLDTLIALHGAALFNIAQLAEKHNDNKLKEFLQKSRENRVKLEKIFKLPIMNYRSENISRLGENLQTLIKYTYDWIRDYSDLFERLSKSTELTTRLKKQYNDFSKKYLS